MNVSERKEGGKERRKGREKGKLLPPWSPVILRLYLIHLITNLTQFSNYFILFDLETGTEFWFSVNSCIVLGFRTYFS